MAMAFLMLFSITLPGVAFAEEPQALEETMEEVVVNQVEEEPAVEAVETVEPQETEGEVEPQDDPQVDTTEPEEKSEQVSEETGVEADGDLTEEANDLEGSVKASDENEDQPQSVLDEINEGLSLEADVYVEKRKATVTAKAHNGTAHELTDGSFSFELPGVEGKIKQNGDEAVAVFKKLEDGHYEVTVTYEANVVIDGSVQAVSRSQSVAFQIGEDPVEAMIDVYHYYDSNENVLMLLAELSEYHKAKGTWTFEVDGQKETVQTKGDPWAEVWFELSNPEPGKQYEAVVTFEGKADKEKVIGSATHIFTLIDPTLDYVCNDKGLHVTATLNGADTAEGEWWFGLWNWDAEDYTDIHESGWVDGTSYTYTFDRSLLVPGYYDVDMGFYGWVNGVEDGAFVTYGAWIEENDPCAAKIDVPKPGEGEKPGEGHQPDDGKSVTPEQPKQTSGEVKQGATMPKTATQYPLGMVIGAFVALLGVGMYLIRRRNALQS
jgi:hypothetical protein